MDVQHQQGVRLHRARRRLATAVSDGAHVQPVPQSSADDVQRIIRRDFPLAHREMVRSLLERSGDTPRVHMATPKLSEGKLSNSRTQWRSPVRTIGMSWRRRSIRRTRERSGPESSSRPRASDPSSNATGCSTRSGLIVAERLKFALAVAAAAISPSPAPCTFPTASPWPTCPWLAIASMLASAAPGETCASPMDRDRRPV